MGLDITAYSHLKHVGQHEKDPALNEGEHADAYRPLFRLDTYKDWQRAFELAADGGLVWFH